MRSVHRSGERVIIAVIKLVSLSSHSGMSHDNIAVIMQAQMYFMSGERTLEYRQLAIVVKGIASCVSSLNFSSHSLSPG